MKRNCQFLMSNIKKYLIHHNILYVKKHLTIKIMYIAFICILRIVVLSFNIWQKQIIEFSKI